MDYRIEIESIGRIKFLMEYDLSKSSQENILLEQKVVSKLTDNQELARTAGYKNVTSKQADELSAAGKLVYASQSGGLKNLISTDQMSKFRRDVDKAGDQKSNRERYGVVKQGRNLTGPIEALWTNWGHETSGLVELGLTFGGMALVATGIGSPLGLVMIGAGTAIGVADAIKYYQEGDPYTGTMMMALQLIPGGELISGLSKYSPRFAKNLPEFQRILKKMESNKSLTDLEGKLYEEGVKAFNKYLPELSQKLVKYSFEAAKNSLRGATLGNVVIFFIKILQLLGKSTNFISKLIIKIGRISITIDQLWTLMATPESWRMQIRNKSDFAKMLDLLYSGTLGKSVVDGLWVIWNIIWNSDGTSNIEGEKQITDAVIDTGMKEVTDMEESFIVDMDNLSKTPLNDIGINKWKNVNLNIGRIDRIQKNTPVTIESILDGKQTLRKGQKGSVVRDIQKMLLRLGFDLGETGEAGIDGDFGNITHNSIIQFQKDNNLKDKSGVVGKETMSLIKKQYDEE